MSDHRLTALLGILGDGAVAGDSLQQFRQLLLGIGDELEALLTFNVTLASDKLAAGEACIKTWVAPFPCEITAIYGVKSTSTATAVAVLTADAVNPLTGTNVDLHALTNDTPASQTLSATATNLRLNTGNLLKATFTAGGGGALDGGTVVFFIKPIKIYE